MRTFEIKEAKRESVPILVSLIGPSGSGKTWSALELATGMQQVTGGEIYVIDTEARRSLHYADNFRFKHVQFEAPFAPSDYLAAIEQCYQSGGRNIVVDSFSHVHESTGGVLDQYEHEMQRLSKGTMDDKYKFIAWVKPKMELRKMINAILQMNCNFIFTFRSKEKLKLIPGQQPQQLGWQPIIGDELLYEMTLSILLYPASNGIPTWDTQYMGEKAVLKLPNQFKEIFKEKKPLDREIGSRLAIWARGSSVDRPTVIESPPVAAPPPSELFLVYMSGIHQCHSLAELKQAWSVIWKTRGKLNENELLQLEVAKNEMKEQLKEATNATI